MDEFRNWWRCLAFFCARSWLSFFFFSAWKIFKAHHIASNVQNWKDKQHFVSDYQIKQTVKIYIACEWKIETTGKLTSSINCYWMPLNLLVQITFCLILQFSVRLALIIFASLFLLLFMSSTVLFQLTFIFIYSIFSKKFSVSVK